MFDPCQPVFHHLAAAVRRPVRHMAHRVAGRAVRRTGSHAAPLHPAQSVPTACFPAPGALPAGPGLAASAGTLGGIAGIGAAALLSAGLAVAGLRLGAGSSGGSGGTAGAEGGSPTVATGQASSGSAIGGELGPTSNAGIDQFARPPALNAGLPAGWLAGPDTLTVGTPNSAWALPLSWTAAPSAGTTPSGASFVAASFAPNNVPDISTEHATAVPEPTSLALLAVGSVVVLFFRAVSRRSSTPSETTVR